MHSKTCKHCGKEFEARTVRGSYCPGTCYTAHEIEDGRRRAARFTPERHRAHILVGCAIAKGELIRQPCEICGSWRYIQAHHDDYARPLDVRWLCKRHHKQHHDKHGPGKNAFRTTEEAVR